MVAMTEASLAAKTKLSGEKRYGKTRQDYEMELVRVSAASSGTDMISRTLRIRLAREPSTRLTSNGKQIVEQRTRNIPPSLLLSNLISFAPYLNEH